jgi:ribulose-phosphate 3-epimerase
LRGNALELKRGGNILLAPSILSARPLAIGESIQSLGGECDWIHVDIMDGHFVPNLSYGPSVVRALKRGFPDLFVDVHIMVEPAEDFLEMFIDAGPDILTVHVEASTHIHRALQVIAASGTRPGVSLNPGTPVCLLEPILPLVDLVLVMSVNPGFGGQKLIPEVLPKIVELAQIRAARSLDFLIEADGGVNAQTASELASSGCDVLVAGSSVFDADSPAEAARAIKRGAEIKWRA